MKSSLNRSPIFCLRGYRQISMGYPRFRKRVGATLSSDSVSDGHKSNVGDFVWSAQRFPHDSIASGCRKF